MTLEFITLRNYASRCNDYQDDNVNSITNNTVYKQRDCWGWNQVAGVAATTITTSIAYPITYDGVPLPIVSALGEKAGGTAATIGELGLSTAFSAMASVCLTTGCTVVLVAQQLGNFNASNYYAYAFLVRGTYASL